jgi:hypothetical protein
LVVGLAVVLGGPFTAYLSHQVPLWRRQVLLERRAAAIRSAIQNEPLRISVIEHGTVPGAGRELHLDPPDKVTLSVDSRVYDWVLPLGIVTIGSNPVTTRETRRFVFPQAPLDALRQTLIREHFFDLDDSDGKDPNFAKTTILVTAGKFKKAVDVYSWGEGPEGLRKRSRALRVLQVILAGFDDPDLKEMRKGYQKLIDAAGK